MSFWSELRRRRVIKVAVAYAIVGLGVGEGTQIFLPGVGAPSWVPNVILVLIVLGFPAALVLAWAYDVTPEGVKRDAGSERVSDVTSAAPTKTEPPTADSTATAGATPPSDRLSIAVLPFLNLSGDPENEYFSDGVTDEILRHLAQIHGLKVISRTSVMRYKGTSKSIREIAAELQVGTILEGSVQREPGRVRVVAQLIDATTDVHLWAETYDRDLADVFATQSDIALNVSDALRASLTGEEKRRILERPTGDFEAYDQYVLGRYHWYRFTDDGARLAGEYFRKALQLDPSFAAAHSGLANLHLLLGGAPLNVLPASQAMPDAKHAAERAIELDPTLGAAYEVLALVQGWFELDWNTARKTATRGTIVDPNSSLAWGARAHTHDICAMHEEAVRSVDRALELDPLAGLTLQNAAWVYYHARRYGDAERYARRILEMEPGFPIGVFTLAEVLLAQDRDAEALDVIEPHAAAMEAFDYGKAILAYGLGKVGRAEEAIRHAEGLIELCREDKAAWSGVALAYLGAGKRDLALQFIERIPEQRPPGGLMTAYLGVLPLFDELREEKRFLAVLDSIGWSQMAG